MTMSLADQEKPEVSVGVISSDQHLTIRVQGKSAAAGASAETESEISLDQESTASNFALAYGHRYYAAGNIFLSFDETEQRRLDSLHRLLRLCLDGELTAVSRAGAHAACCMCGSLF